MPYEELIKRLRSAAQWADKGLVITPNICLEAADAIETLSKMEKTTKPHGRLIDADALMNEFEKAQRTMQQHGREYSCSFMSSSQEISTKWYCVEDMLENAPTVIPASKENE